MKIEHASVAMQACHTFYSECEVSVESEHSFREVVDGVSASLGDDAAEQTQLRLMLESLIAHMLSLLSDGKGARRRARQAGEGMTRPESEGTDSPGRLTARPERAVDMSWRSERTETLREHESSDFSSVGKVCTADGRELSFNLELSMCRDYSCTRTVRQSGTVRLRDPLVLNFDGKAAELSGQCFAFDLDVDGTREMIDGLGSASGYLAFDRNGDGVINDGRELFGTRSGDGFADLMALDDDGNRWLDEADKAFTFLRVWQHDATGKPRLSTLGEKGVGALYLGSVDTPFSLTDGDNRVLAQIRASGVYLSEDGRAGSLQQIDLAV